MTGVHGHANMERYLQPGGPMTVSVEFCLEMARLFDEQYEGTVALAVGIGKTNHMGLIDTGQVCGAAPPGSFSTATAEQCPPGQQGICWTTVRDTNGASSPIYNGAAGIMVYFATNQKTEADANNDGVVDDDDLALTASYVQGQCIDLDGQSSHNEWLYCMCDVQFLPPLSPAPPSPPALPPPPSPRAPASCFTVKPDRRDQGDATTACDGVTETDILYQDDCLAAYDYFRIRNEGAPNHIGSNPQPGVGGPVNGFKIYAYSGNTWPHEDPQPVPDRSDVIVPTDVQAITGLNSNAWPPGCWWQTDGSTSNRNKRIWWWPAEANTPDGSENAYQICETACPSPPAPPAAPPTDGQRCFNLIAHGRTGLEDASLADEFPGPSGMGCKRHCEEAGTGRDWACFRSCDVFAYGYTHEGVLYQPRSLSECDAYCDVKWADGSCMAEGGQPLCSDRSKSRQICKGIGAFVDYGCRRMEILINGAIAHYGRDVCGPDSIPRPPPYPPFPPSMAPAPPPDYPYYLAPMASSTCPTGATLTDEAACAVAGNVLLAALGQTPGRGIVTNTGGTGCSGWGLVPTGCSLQSDGDWAIHFKTGGSDCVNGLGGYSLVCSQTHPPPPPPPPLSPRGGYAAFECSGSAAGGGVIDSTVEPNMCDSQADAQLECEHQGMRLATLYSADDQTAALAARQAAGQGAFNHWIGGYIADDDGERSTVEDMRAYWKELDEAGTPLEAIITEGDDWVAHTQAYTLWFLQRTTATANNSPFTEIQANTFTDPRAFGLQLRGSNGYWRYRADNQPAYALCQAPG